MEQKPAAPTDDQPHVGKSIVQPTPAPPSEPNAPIRPYDALFPANRDGQRPLMYSLDGKPPKGLVIRK